MNNNNHFNTNNWIGTTHLDFFKNSSNALSNYTYNTSNILENDILITSNINYLYTSNSSNSNIFFTSNTSNIILSRYDPMIKEEIVEIAYPTGAIETSHTYIQNLNLLGEIRFLCKYANDFPPFISGLPEYRVKITPSGKLFCYYTFDPLINATYLSGWVDVINSIVGLNADSVNQGILIAGLEAQILNLKVATSDQFLSLISNLEDDYIITSGAANRIRNEIETITTSSGAAASRTSMLVAYNNFRLFMTTGRISRFNTALEIINFRISQNAAAGFFLGIGGAAFGFLYSLILSYKHNDFLATSISSAIESNVSLTTEQKRNLHESNLNDMSSNMIDQLEYTYNINLIQGFTNSNIITQQYLNSINTNELKLNQTNISNIFVASNVLSNINLNQGFLNSNITNQQYISNLKTDNLFLNNGNISNINGISTNEIIASGKIKQNNILLDNIYLTSNHLYNLAFNYTTERQYPSKLFTSSSIEGTATLLNKLVYKQILFLNTTSISYGSGFYEVFSSSTFDNGITTKDRLFNFNTSETTNTSRWGISLYNSGTGNYQGDNSIDGIYFGDWVIIKPPNPIILNIISALLCVIVNNIATINLIIIGTNTHLSITS
jgi:hypothetical protein